MKIKKPLPIKLWLDDVRPMPPEYTYWAMTASGAIKRLVTGMVTDISLDHDLGEPLWLVGTGYQVAMWIEEAAFLGKITKLNWKVHSANPVGSEKITQALKNADRFWETKKS